MTSGQQSRWRGDFFTGLAVVLPVVASIALVVWLFGTVSNITDTLLFFLPRQMTHQNNGTGAVHWYWSLLALLLTAVLLMLLGRLTRHYLGVQLIRVMDWTLFKVPLLNRIYGTLKQVNEALTSSNKSSFKQVVLVEFPHSGSLTLAFVTGDQHEEIEAKTGEKMVSVFIPTTPNPTSGFMVFIPESKVRKLDMSVPEGIKYLISLGAIAPANPNAQRIEASKPAVRH